MGPTVRRSAFALLIIAGFVQAAEGGWPVHRAGTRRQLAAGKHPVVAPVPEVDLGTVPRYPWGYFGAKPAPYHVYHRGYYGDYFDWSFRRGP
jgi:hypothetical protein